jgi:hypothetical protein
MGKQIGMRSGTGSDKNQLAFIYCINHQPIRLDMTFAKARVIPGECVIVMLRCKLPSTEKRFEYGVQAGHIESSFDGPFPISPVLGSGLKTQHPH